ncbi:MAG: hypothetical protein Q7S28_03995 [bacterium]|nr:hypothetical protein [bacterium]
MTDAEEAAENIAIAQAKPKAHYWVFIGRFVALVLGSLALTIGISAYLQYREAYSRYGQFNGQSVAIDVFAETMAKAVNDPVSSVYKGAMADTAGGKTPEETFQMYLDAIEAGDYVLANTYVMEAGREDDLNHLKRLQEKDAVESYVRLLWRFEPDGEITGDTFHMKAPAGEENYLMYFVRYPNGIWKIAGTNFMLT